jgi:hypothetical protein
MTCQDRLGTTARKSQRNRRRCCHTTTTTQYAAEMTELLPAFTSAERFYPTIPPRPQATVASALGMALSSSPSSMKQVGQAGAGDEYTLVAKLLTEKAPARGVTADYFCHTLVTVNPHSTPCVGKFTLAGLLAGSGLPSTFPVEQLQAERLFNGQYLTNLTGLANGSVVLSDFLDARTANIYRIGCDTAAFANYNRSKNLIVDGDIETLADPVRVHLTFQQRQRSLSLSFSRFWRNSDGKQLNDGLLHVGCSRPPADAPTSERCCWKAHSQWLQRDDEHRWCWPLQPL